jgi:hypothetical protein
VTLFDDGGHVKGERMANRGRKKFSFNPEGLLSAVPDKPKFSEGTDDEGYEASEIVTCSTAEDGSWGTAHFKYPGDWHRGVQVIIQRHLVPEYQTMADFYRDAIWHRLNWVAAHSQNRELTEIATMNLLSLALDAQDLRERKAEELLAKVKSRIDKDFDRGLPIDHHELGKWRKYTLNFDKKYRNSILTYIDRFYDPTLDHEVEEGPGVIYDGVDWDE